MLLERIIGFGGDVFVYSMLDVLVGMFLETSCYLDLDLVRRAILIMLPT